MGKKKKATEPSRLEKLATKLFSDEAARANFCASLQAPQEYAESLLLLNNGEALPFPQLPKRPEQPEFIARLDGAGLRPGAHAQHQSGKYYCLDYSSVIACLPLLEIAKRTTELVDLVIDVCASPGGKTLFAKHLLKPQKMVANEVTKSRLASLGSNLRRVGAENVLITSVFPSKLSDEYASQAKVVIVDAPCSGQSLLAKGEKVQGCFHPSVINGNSNRQKRILAESSALVAEGGFLLYSTCTYAPEENEDVVAWFLKRNPTFRPVEVEALYEFRSAVTSEFPCYRLFPQSGLGAGSFTVLLERLVQTDQI